MRTRRSQTSSDPVSPDDSGNLASTKVDSGKHQSVLLHEAIEQLQINVSDVVVDGTLGGAGHARAIVEKLDTTGTFVGFDLDHDAIVRTQVVLAGVAPRTVCIESNFRNLGRELPVHGIQSIDKVLFDLGWSGFQLSAGRGFSFLADEPLLMTYTKDQSEDVLTAREIVNDWSEESIADIIYGWGEERYSRRIAKAIVERRRQMPFALASDLGEVIKSSVPPVYRHGRLHPATRTFQALRIATNDELGAIKEGIEAAWSMLRVGGRIAVITFHSIEDRMVKGLFLDYERLGQGTRITRSPLKPTKEELAHNPRARSAKLRVIEKK